MKKVIIGAIIIGLAIIFTGFLIASKPIPKPIGATVGPEHFNREYFYGGLVQGGGIVTKTASTTATFTAADVCDNSFIKFAPDKPNSSTTVPTAASIINRCLPKNGDFKTIIFYNTGLAASTTHMAASTGTIIFAPEVTGSNVAIAGLNAIEIRMVRASSTGVFMFMSEQVPQ